MQVSMKIESESSLNVKHERRGNLNFHCVHNRLFAMLKIQNYHSLRKFLQFNCRSIRMSGKMLKKSHKIKLPRDILPRFFDENHNFKLN